MILVITHCNMNKKYPDTLKNNYLPNYGKLVTLASSSKSFDMKSLAFSEM